ncbi:M48 family metalloprotease [Carbonactinospora thermoautotrophica]|uniref:M48 family metalloprotease n=1 Tax=Carbonactinospora thermoautotrophica TaxID=1469144 RepID=UPI003DAA36E2
MRAAKLDWPPSDAVLVAVLVVLGSALVAVILLTTPWQPLGKAAQQATVSAARDFTPAEIARSQAYRQAIVPPAYLALGVGLATALLLGLTPLGARLVELAARPFGGGWLAEVVVGGVAVALVTRLAQIPFNAWAEAVRRRHGLSAQTWGTWTLDQLKGFAVGAVLLLLVLLGLYGLARLSPRLWWAPAAVGGAVLVVAVSFLYPLLVEPVFNKFAPMPAGPLRDSLVRPAERDGVPVREVLVADASRRTTALNAYVSGFGSTRRIVVYDTTLKSASPDETRLIVAHELGHAKRGDVLHGTLIGALGLAFGVCLLALLVSWTPLLRRAGVERFADPRSLALVLALAAIFAQVAGPVQMLVSRRIEARADVHALDLTRDPATFARMQRQLAVSNIATLRPNPLEFALFASHPTAPMRIALARDWARLHGLPEPPPQAR